MNEQHALHLERLDRLTDTAVQHGLTSIAGPVAELTEDEAKHTLVVAVGMLADLVKRTR